MNSKKIYDYIKYLITEDRFDEAREFARENKLKESEIEIIAKANFFLAGQKSKKYGFYKRAIELYSQLPKEDTQKEINEIYEIIDKNVNTKKFLERYNKNFQEISEQDNSGLVNYSKLIDLDQYVPMMKTIIQN